MHKEKGFTLLEVVVSLAVLSAVIMLCFRVMSGAVDASSKSERWEIAALLGESQLRESLSPFPETGDSDGIFPDPNGDYSWHRTVAQALHKDAREVHIEVKWKEADQEETLTISGLAVK